MPRHDNYPLLPDEVVAIYDHIAAAQSALDGRFEARIKELKALQLDVAAKQKAIGSVADAEKIRADADLYLEKQKKVAAAQLGVVQVQEARVVEREAALEKQLKVVQSAEQEVANAKQAQLAEVASAAAVNAERTRALDKREAALSSEETRLNSLSAALNDKEVALGRKAETLRKAAAGI